MCQGCATSHAWELGDRRGDGLFVRSSHRYGGTDIARYRMMAGGDSRYLLVLLLGMLGCTALPSEDGTSAGSSMTAGDSSTTAGGTSVSVGGAAGGGGDGVGPCSGSGGHGGGCPAPCGISGGGGMWSPCEVPVDPSCDPTGTWHVTYAPQPSQGGNGGSSAVGPVLPADTLVVSKTLTGGLIADMARGPRPQDCAGSHDGTVGSYSITASLSGPCRLKVSEGWEYIVCFEPYREGRTLDLDMSDNQAVGMGEDTNGCVCAPPAPQASTYSAHASRD